MSAQPATEATGTPVNGPLRVLQVGAGSMGRGWLRNVQDCDEVELAGVADLDVTTAKTALEELGIAGVPVAGTLDELVDEVRPDAVST